MVAFFVLSFETDPSITETGWMDDGCFELSLLLLFFSYFLLYSINRLSYLHWLCTFSFLFSACLLSPCWLDGGWMGE